MDLMNIDDFASTDGLSGYASDAGGMLGGAVAGGAAAIALTKGVNFIPWVKDRKWAKIGVVAAAALVAGAAIGRYHRGAGWAVGTVGAAVAVLAAAGQASPMLSIEGALADAGDDEFLLGLNGGNDRELLLGLGYANNTEMSVETPIPGLEGTGNNSDVRTEMPIPGLSALS